MATAQHPLNPQFTNQETAEMAEAEASPLHTYRWLFDRTQRTLQWKQLSEEQAAEAELGTFTTPTHRGEIVQLTEAQLPQARQKVRLMLCS